MAEVADLHLPEDVLEEEEIEALNSVPYWPPFDHDENYPYDPDSDVDPFSPRPSDFGHSDHSVHNQVIFEGDDIEREVCVELVGSEGSDSDSVTDLNYFNREDHQVNLVYNLFERCNEETHIIEHRSGSFSNPFADDDSSFRVIDENDEMGSNYLELGLGIGLDIDRANGDENDDNSGFMIEEFGGEFYVSRRVELGESVESSARRAVEPFRDGLRVVRIGSDSDEEEEGIVGIDLHSADDEGFGAPDDLGLPLCWDCLRLEDQRESNEDFEWEEVDERVDEREVLSMVIDADEERSVSTEIHSEEVGDEGEAVMRTLEWEVLLAVNNLDRNPELEHEADHDDYIYPAEYEMLFGQFTEHESSLRGSPPAAKSVLENLPSVVVTQEDVENKSAICAVCKDEIAMEEQVKQLPCSHYYHGDCILPWLSIRNTCPVCRFELRTDDPDYERMRIQRAASRNLSRGGQVRYDFEIFREQ
ncbi:zinc finger protein [Macleaya cordata]|uniref:RING-type E3 ubiquitin transferase n=1 Tax=Macleaya cordata TaxID=56857 RepID=A0A200QQ11_MACCD|nr:zinc finger protein [Macleaya cordata]